MGSSALHCRRAMPPAGTGGPALSGMLWLTSTSATSLQVPAANLEAPAQAVTLLPVTLWLRAACRQAGACQELPVIERPSHLAVSVVWMDGDADRLFWLSFACQFECRA